MDANKLEEILLVKFKNKQLLSQALIHRSALNETDDLTLASYERLEFLGDAVLDLVISEELYARCQHLDEGGLSKGRSNLVRGSTLAIIAQELNLGDFLLLGKGYRESGGRTTESNLAAAYEAVVAAIYVDQGLDCARDFIIRTYGIRLTDLTSIDTETNNYKSLLQEHYQGIGKASPTYRVVSMEGPDHEPVFTIQVSVEENTIGTGSGTRKSEAEQNAAADALNKLIIESRI